MKTALLIYFVLNIILTIAMIGKPRKAITPGDACFVAICMGAWIVCVLAFM